MKCAIFKICKLAGSPYSCMGSILVAPPESLLGESSIILGFLVVVPAV